MHAPTSALGSNLGDRLATPPARGRPAGATPGIRVVRSSRVWETDPVGGPRAARVPERRARGRDRRSTRATCSRPCNARRGRARPRTRESVGSPHDRHRRPALSTTSIVDEPTSRSRTRGCTSGRSCSLPLLELDPDPVLPGGRRLLDVRARPPAERSAVRAAARPRLTRADPRVPGLRYSARWTSRWSAPAAWARRSPCCSRARATGSSPSSGRGGHARSRRRVLPGVPVLDPAGRGRGRRARPASASPDDAILPTSSASLAGRGRVPDGRPWSPTCRARSGLDVLAPPRAAGAHRLAIHPLQTFPDVGAGDRRGSPGARSRSPPTTRRARRSASGSRATWWRAVPRSPTSCARCITPRRCSPRTTSSPPRRSRSSCSATAGVPRPARGDGAAAARDARRTSRGSARRARSRVPPCAATPAPSTGNLEALARARARTRSRLRRAVPVALDLAVAAGRLAPEGRAAVEEVLARWS